MALPFIPQGLLNRTRTQIVFASFPYLNISAFNMGKTQAKVSFTTPFTTQIHTATGIVNSPEPFVMTNIAVGVLRTQPLGAAFLAQIQAGVILGEVVAYGDTSALPAIPLYDASVTGFDIAAFDGNDPIIAVTISGVFYPNADLWF
jgi:hypothetical protein